MKLPDNFQMREHLRPCRFHIRLYSAGTDHGYNNFYCPIEGPRSAVGLVQLLEGTTKALYCLCAHYAVLKLVPIDYRLYSIVFEKNEFFLMSVLNWNLDEFEGSRVVHCLSIYIIWCFKSFVLFGFSFSFVPCFFQIVFWCDGGHQSLIHFVKHTCSWKKRKQNISAPVEKESSVSGQIGSTFSFKQTWLPFLK